MANFNQAMKWMEEGYKVRRNGWGNRDYYWYVDTNESFDNLWCIREPDGDKAAMIRSWVEADDWEIYRISGRLLEMIERGVGAIRTSGREPAIIIINEEDSEDLKKECLADGLGFTPEFILGIKVLIIPPHLRDNTLLNEHEAMIISDEHYKLLKDTLMISQYKAVSRTDGKRS